MILYHDYKALHIVGLLFFVMSLMKHHYGTGNGKLLKSILYSSAILTLSTGTTMMVRWGLVEAIPPWIWGKYISMLGLVITIWFPKNGSKIVVIRPYFVAFMLILGVACSVYKPI